MMERYQRMNLVDCYFKDKMKINDPLKYIKFSLFFMYFF